MPNQRYFGNRSKADMVRTEMKSWKRRAGQAESALRHLRNVADNPASSGAEIVDTVYGVINEWEELQEKHDLGGEQKCLRCRGTGLVSASAVPTPEDLMCRTFGCGLPEGHESDHSHGPLSAQLDNQRRKNAAWAGQAPESAGLVPTEGGSS